MTAHFTVNPSAGALRIAPEGRVLVEILPDGRLEYGPGYDPDEAARTFWEAMAHWAPARSAQTWVTYRLASGEPIYGEYAWVENAEYFDDVDEPTEVIKETWSLVSSETITFGANEVDEDEDEDEEALP